MLLAQVKGHVVSTAKVDNLNGRKLLLVEVVTVRPDGLHGTGRDLVCVDAVGAGDALLAYSTLAMVATRSEVIASMLGSFAAGVECEHEGNAPVTPGAVRKKMRRVETHTLYGHDGQ